MTSSAALRLRTQAHVTKQDLESFLNKAGGQGGTCAVRLKHWALGCSGASTGLPGFGQWWRPDS